MYTHDSYALAMYVLTDGQEGSLPATASPGFDIREDTAHSDEPVSLDEYVLYEDLFTAYG